MGKASQVLDHGGAHKRGHARRATKEARCPLGWGPCAWSKTRSAAPAHACARASLRTPAWRAHGNPDGFESERRARPRQGSQPNTRRPSVQRRPARTTVPVAIETSSPSQRPLRRPLRKPRVLTCTVWRSQYGGRRGSGRQRHMLPSEDQVGLMRQPRGHIAGKGLRHRAVDAALGTTRGGCLASQGRPRSNGLVERAAHAFRRALERSLRPRPWARTYGTRGRIGALTGAP